MAKFDMPPAERKAPTEAMIEKVVMDTINKYQFASGLNLRSQEVGAIVKEVAQDVSKTFAYYARQFNIPQQDVRDAVTNILDAWDRTGQPPVNVFSDVRSYLRKEHPKEFKEYQIAAKARALDTDKRAAELAAQGIAPDQALFRIAYEDVHEERRKKMPGLYSAEDVFGKEEGTSVAKKEAAAPSRVANLEDMIDDSKRTHKQLRSDLLHEGDIAERSKIRKRIAANLDETITAIEGSGQAEKYQKELEQLREARSKPMYGGSAAVAEAAPVEAHKKTRAEERAEAKREREATEKQARADARAEREQREAQRKADAEAAKIAKKSKGEAPSKDEIAEKLAQKAIARLRGAETGAVRDVLAGGEAIAPQRAVAMEETKKPKTSEPAKAPQRPKGREEIAEIAQMKFNIKPDANVETPGPGEEREAAAGVRKTKKAEPGVAEITPMEEVKSMLDAVARGLGVELYENLGTQKNYARDRVRSQINSEIKATQTQILREPGNKSVLEKDIERSKKMLAELLRISV